MTGPESEPENKKTTDPPVAEVADGTSPSELSSIDSSLSDAGASGENKSDLPELTAEAASDIAVPEPCAAAEDAAQSGNESASSLTLTQHHVSHLLSDVLSDEGETRPAIKRLRIPMVFDCLLGVGLLVAVGGFTIGLFHMYLIHSASQCISQQRYKDAITILKSAPMPQVYARTGSDTEELLSKARYLDAMAKLESGTDVAAALKELNEILPGSRYFALAQEAINENTEPAPIMLQGGAETTETAPVPEPKQTLLEKTLKEEERK